MVMISAGASETEENLNVSPEATEDIRFEFSQVMREAELTRLLIPLFRENRVDELQIRAAASTVHSIYNGIERVFILILKDLKIRIPDGSKWHSELLVQMNQRGFISEELHRKLRDYQSFRHFFRHSYGFMLDHELLSPLVEDAISTVERLMSEILEGE